MSRLLKVFVKKYSERYTDAWLDLFSKYFVHLLKHYHQTDVLFLKSIEEGTQTDEGTLVMLQLLGEDTSSTYQSHIEEWNKQLEFSSLKNYIYHIYPQKAQMRLYSNTISYLYLPTELNTEDGESINQFLFSLAEVANSLINSIFTNAQLQEEQEVKKGVYLAHTSQDVSQIRESMRRELQAMGFDIYPRENILQKEDIEHEIRENLKNCFISIHLVGATYQESFSHKNKPLGKLENEISADYCQNYHDFKRVIWIASEKVEEENQALYINTIFRDKQLNRGADIISCTLEELKGLVEEKIYKQNQSFDNEQQNHIYLIYDETAEQDAMNIYNSIKEKGEMIAQINTSKYDAKDSWMQEHLSNLMNCKAVFFVNNSKSLKWFHSKLTDTFKIKNIGRKKDFTTRVLLSRTIQDLPYNNLYESVKLVNMNDENVFQNFLIRFNN
ncbi:MAG: hypothetical protein MUC49_13535 [Raineya sp.]|jgi:hypothetical protein|nr:hypothetical protein [Raineya sp.]